MSGDILVTGATGAVGSKVVQELALRDAHVRAAVHTKEKLYRIRTSKAEIAYVDYNDEDSVEQALKGVERLFLLTPSCPGQVMQSKRLITRAVDFGVSHVVYLSIIGADSNPGIRFEQWHYETERFLRQCGIAYTIVRPNSFMQNFITIMPPADGLVYLPMGDGRVSYIDAYDIAEAVSAILENPQPHHEKVYSLTGPRGLEMNDITRIMTEMSGQHIAYIDIPEETARHAMISYGLPSWRIEALLELHAINRAGLRADVTSAIPDLLGRDARTFEEFAAANAETFRALAHHAHLH
jgi:uncharacterized protein YbjT (DUF2867 family)